MNAQMPLEARLRRTLSRTVRPVQTALRRTLLYALDSALLLRPANPDANRMLMVRLDNIGDFVVWLDAAKALVAHYRAAGCRVTLLGNAAWAEFAAELEIFEEVLPLRPEAFRHDLRYRRRLLRRVRETGFGTVLQPTVNRLPEMGDAVVRVCGARERIGVAPASVLPGLAEDDGRRGLYTRLIAADPEADGEMQANAQVVRTLTGSGYQARMADLRAAFGDTCLRELAGHFASGAYVVLFPGASAAGRQWPATRFTELARQCVKTFGCQVVLCGGPGDVVIAEQAASAAGAGVMSLAGKTSLKQLSALIANAQLLVSNETSAVHLAAALGVPSVCITGGGHFGRFVPYPAEVEEERPLPVVASRQMECFGCNWKCRFHPAKGKPMPCVEQVSVDAVWTLAAPLFGRRFEEVEA